MSATVSQLDFDIAPAVAALDRLEAADAELRSEVLQTQKAAQVAFGQSADSLGDIAAETRRAAAAQQQFASQIAGLVKELRDQGAAEAELRRQAAASAAERRKANAEARAAAQAEKQAAKEAAQAAKEAAAAERLKAKAAVDAQKEYAGQTQNALSKIAGAFGVSFSIGAAVSAVRAFFGEVVDTAQKTEALLSKLSFANGGNQQAAARDLGFVRAEAERLGLDLTTAGNSYGSFAAAAAAANFPLSEARKLFTATAGASATLKLSQDDTNGVLLALTQILSKGTVAAEELRGQIGERLPGAFSVAAKAMGVTEQQLNKLLETGQVKASEFLPKFAEQLQKTFGDGTAAAADATGANLNRLGNELDAFYLRFQSFTGLISRNAAVLAKGFNVVADALTSAGRISRAAQLAQGDVTGYQADLEKRLKEASEFSDGSGDGSAAVKALLTGERYRLEQAIKEAQAQSTAINKQVSDRLLPSGELAKEQIARARRLEGLKLELATLNEVAEARKKADSPADLEGLIKKQEDLIKALKARQKAATAENTDGSKNDFLFGKGGLNEQIKAAEKELDRLLGRVDKTAKAAADRLAAALRALAEAQRELSNKAAEAATKDADDARLRAQLAYDQALRLVDQAEKRIQDAELKVKKAGGRGTRADGVVDGADASNLGVLRRAATDAYNKELARIAREEAALLLSLQKESDQKELDQLEAAFNEQVRLHQNQADVLLALEAKYQRDRDALLRAQATRGAEHQQRLSSSQASATAEVYGEGTGVSQIEAQRTAQQQQLDAERTFAEKRLEILKDAKGKEAEEERAALAAQLLRVRQQQIALNTVIKKNKVEDAIFKGLFGEKDSEENRQKFKQDVQQVISSVGEILSAQLAAEQQKVQAHQDNINSLNAQLAAEIQLNRQGAASNIQTIQQQLKEEKAAKREALAESRAIAKQQQAINDLQAISSIALAVANIIAGWSEVPLVGSILGIVAAGAMVAAFISTKASAADAAKTSSFFVGGYTGDGDPRQVSTAVGPRPYEYHKGEFVMPADKTALLRNSLLAPIHENRAWDIDWPAVASALPDLSLPDTMRAEKAAYVRHTLEISHGPLQAKFDALHAELAQIKASNQRMADRTDKVPLGDGRYMELSDNGSSKVVSVG